MVRPTTLSAVARAAARDHGAVDPARHRDGNRIVLRHAAGVTGEILRRCATRIDDGLNQPIHLLAVFDRPSENRTLDRARSAVSPIASRTCDGSTAPLEQAEPLETAKPADRARSPAPRPRCRRSGYSIVFGSARARPPFTPRPARAPECPLSSRSRNAGERADSDPISRRHSAARAQAPRPPARSPSPRRRSRS